MRERMPVNRRAALLCAALVGCLAAAPVSRAQSYPSKPVRVVVGFAAGGVADITARIVAQKLSDKLGQQLVVENRPSAGGIAAAEAVARAEPDGYTLLLMSNGNAVSVSLFKSLPYQPVEDFAPVSTLGFFDLVLLVNGDSKIGSVKELIAYGKSNPGKLNFGSINIGSTQNLAAELFKAMAGLEATIVPFKGTPAVVTALRSNDIQAGFEILAPVLAQIRSGGLKALAVSADRRFGALPEVPTVMESGLPDYQVASWNAIAAPAKTPRAIVERLNAEINAVLAQPDTRQKLLDLGVSARGGTPAQLRELLTAEIAKWREVVIRAKIERQ